MHLDFTEPATERTPRVVSAVKLHRSAGRRKAGLFLVEGSNCVEAAVARGAATDIFVTESAAGRFPALLNGAASAGVHIHPVTDRAGRQLADTVTPTGLVAVCRPVLVDLDGALNADTRLVSVPVQTSEPGNAGTLIRVADAVGADSVIFTGDTVDPQNGKSARASAGSLFHLPVVRHHEQGDVIDGLRKRGLTIIATAADGELSLDEAGGILAQPTAWLFGNEAHGLPDELLETADHRIHIPIRGRAESLNLATAAAICLYESARAQHRH
ncbi:TrmH family RNA methyltransferase [Corynebacterium pygosceleis]|uniref:RNA methyltransferase n=1 Tax=Corynebacterium pygosceleis TaxID=2800406 RepID=A0A9Q4CAA5_9CORY|nr:RNA methyltransferase [Corynebacterium pygosceleis]MCK7637789.1 RNA methyltransferase [Corynebacterium pygosceleis]MCK7675503.1 RNA methyltransferase [Corynebacterium pygosceleis]MCL0121103.1 RNA methyltransferase [Corynebacterium pygosceleis]MCX7444671.1 RNA methyltransferase [Corynebacterium pygosceleis]MCX7468503.1 RNA methyltransferase [Corynebacterium pygosceleis]